MFTARLPLRIAALARSAAAPTTGQFVARTALSRNVILPLLSRSYATPAKPKKGSIGASSTRGKATKTRAASSTTAAAKKPKKAAAAKKPKKKAAPKKPTKTPEQLERAAELAKRKKEKAAATKKREHIAQLKADALSPPPVGTSSYLVFLKAKYANDAARVKQVGPQEFIKEVAIEYKSLSSSELESYTRQADSARAESSAAYDAWVAEHTPDQIRRANLARAALRRLDLSKYRPIRDERALPRPATPFLQFWHESRDTSVATRDAARDAGAKWKAMGEGEKQKYVDQYHQALARYKSEYEELYGVPAPSSQAASPSA